jgi:N-acetylneuraminate synthase
MHAAVAAVALGACLYERHLVLDGDQVAIDRAVSSTPAALAELIRLMEATRVALGDGRKVPQEAELPNIRASRRGLYAARALSAGTQIGPDDVVVLRPATSLAPSQLPLVVGSTLRRDVPSGAAFEVGDLALERAS